MVLVKTLKTKSYFKRYQVKLRRRREGKTDYLARKILIHQDKNKYNSKKYRFVVRVTNTKIICQIIYASLIGDHVICQADSTELINFGIPVGLTNYAASYATGLLIARRLLKKLKLDQTFKGVEEITGEDYHVEENYEDIRPFKCLLDVGIIRTTIGNRVFGAMKGACDGGLNIPHSNKKFFGFKDDNYDAEAHRARIFGNHVSSYMNTLSEEDPDKYQQHFSQYIKHNITSDSIENMYASAHQKIRENPLRKKEVKPKLPIRKEGNVIYTSKGSYIKLKKLTKEQRAERVSNKLRQIQEAVLEE